MTGTRHQKVRIGLFAAVAGTLVGVVIAVWGGLHLFHHRDRYVIEIDGSVYGLVRGADVFYNGVTAGSVRSIDVSPRDIRRVRVEIEVDDDTPVRTDTTATMTLAGITGAKVIDLRAGEPTAPRLAPGGTIAVGETTLDRLERQLDRMASQSSQMLERAGRIEASAQQVVDNLAKISDPAQLGELIASSRAAVGDLARAAAAVRGMLEEDRAPLHRSLASVDDSAAQIARAVREDGGQLRAAIADLRQASRSFKELAREVREQPSRLIVSSPKSDRKLP